MMNETIRVVTQLSVLIKIANKFVQNLPHYAGVLRRNKNSIDKITRQQRSNSFGGNQGLILPTRGTYVIS